MKYEYNKINIMKLTEIIPAPTHVGRIDSMESIKPPLLYVSSICCITLIVTQQT